MNELLAVGAGGFVGAVFRFLIGNLLQSLSQRTGFPLGTLAANVLGCLIIGFLAGFIMRRGEFPLEMRLFVFTGFLGALTTFSTFSFETIGLLRAGDTGLALINLALQFGAGFGAVWLGGVIAAR